MKIINPLYDQAFMYLMDNESIAKKILSIILEQEVIAIQSKPQETKLIDKKREIPLSRFDFKAIIRTEGNKERNVLIEIQKSKNPDPIMRFRRYLGKNYIKQETYINLEGKEVTGPLPIITIYFLGYNIEGYDTPAVVVNNQVIDAVTKKTISKKNEFIELLTHPSYILQISRLKQKRKTKIEKFLSIFDQKCKTDDDFVLDVDENKLDEFSEIITYLNRATQDEEIIRKLEYEEDFEAGYEKLEKEVEEAKQREEEAKQREEKERILKEQATQLAKNTSKKLATKLKQLNEPIEIIMQETRLTKEEIDKL
jgi:hypothetical protein